jgi:hypothetical protein
MDKLGKEGKCKVHSRTGHEGPEREFRYSYTLSLTSAPRREWVINAMPWPLYSRQRDPEPVVQEGRWAHRVDLDVCGKPCPHRDSIPRPPSP